MISRRPIPRHNRGRIPSGGAFVPDYTVVAHGNSLTYGFGASPQPTNSYPGVLQTLLGPTVLVKNEGTVGAAGSAMLFEFVSRIGNPNPSGTRVYVTLEIINSIANGESRILDNYKRMCWIGRAWGFRVVAATAWPRAGFDAGEEALRTSINASIVSGWAQFADHLADSGAIPELQDPFDTTYFLNEGTPVHLNNTGYAVVANFMEPHVLTAKDLPVGDYPSIISGISNFCAWWDVWPEFVTTATGVSLLADKFILSNLQQPTGGAQPAYNATGWDGTSPALEFDGATKSMQATTVSVGQRINGTNRPFTITATFRSDTANRMICGWVHGTSGRYNLLRTDASNRLQLARMGDSSTAVGTHTGTTAIGTTPHCVVLTFDGTTCRIWLDGVEETVTPAGAAISTQTFDRVQVGTYLNQLWFDGEIAEVSFSAVAWDASQAARHYAYQKTVRSGLP